MTGPVEKPKPAAREAPGATSVARDFVEFVYALLDEKRAEEIVWLDVSGVTDLADHFLIATVVNQRQAAGIVDACEQERPLVGDDLKQVAVRRDERPRGGAPGDQRGGPRRRRSTSTAKPVRATRRISLSVTPESGATAMPTAARLRSRTRRWATRSFTVQSPQRVGWSAPTWSAVSHSAVRSAVAILVTVRS